MTYRQALDSVYSATRFGGQRGLGRMIRFLGLLGDPQKKLPFLHVAGTKGKGSVTAMLAGALSAGGYRTGGYFSPYVVDFRERMQIDGISITEERFAEVYSRVAPAAQEMEAEGLPPTVFELITASAFCWFAEERCDIAVLEVGLGGRFDATNVIPAPLCAVVNVIDLDHTELLGSTYAEIAFEKCGIIKRGSAVVSFPRQRPEAMAVIARRSAEEGCRLVTPDLSALQVSSRTVFGSDFTYRGMPVHLRMAGEHQIENAVTALEALAVVGHRGFPLPQRALREGLSGAWLPGRMEILSRSPLVMLDGAHNPVSVAALRDSLFDFRLGRLTAVTGMLADKDYRTCMDLIAPYFGRIVVTQPNSPRALPAAKLAEAAAPCCPEVLVEPDARKAARRALSSPGNGVVAFGSLYLASELRPVFLELLGSSDR